MMQKNIFNSAQNPVGSEHIFFYFCGGHLTNFWGLYSITKKKIANLLIGLTDMIKELESEQFVRGTDHGSSNSSSWVTLDLQGTRKVKIPR